MPFECHVDNKLLLLKKISQKTTTVKTKPAYDRCYLLYVFFNGSYLPVKCTKKGFEVCGKYSAVSMVVQLVPYYICI